MPNATPRTIEELRAWYAAHNLPPEEVTRFFIGRDIREPKAFGIYFDGCNYVVYKNKADGSRAVRYQGPDEGYAVNELYERLKQEIVLQKDHNAVSKEPMTRSQRIQKIITWLVIIAIFAGIVWYIIYDVRTTPGTGYYYYDDCWYYFYDDAWYLYTDNGWVPGGDCDDLYDNYNSYYVDYGYSDQYGVPNFELTEYYSNTDHDSSWNSNDTWDSGSTDWNSDW